MQWQVITQKISKDTYNMGNITVMERTTKCESHTADK